MAEQGNDHTVRTQPPMAVPQHFPVIQAIAEQILPVSDRSRRRESEKRMCQQYPPLVTPLPSSVAVSAHSKQRSIRRDGSDLTQLAYCTSSSISMPPLHMPLAPTCSRRKADATLPAPPAWERPLRLARARHGCSDFEDAARATHARREPVVTHRSDLFGVNPGAFEAHYGNSSRTPRMNQSLFRLNTDSRYSNSQSPRPIEHASPSSRKSTRRTNSSI